MKTCERFGRIKAGYERDISYLTNYARRHQGTVPAKSSAVNARAGKARMARELARHFERCLLCG